LIYIINKHLNRHRIYILTMTSHQIQYASQLFLSFSRTLPIKPAAPIIALTGNNFRHSTRLNPAHLKTLSQHWDHVCIIPGLLEYSSDAPHNLNTDQAETALKEEFAKYKNIHYLNMNSINVNDLQISGLTKWPSKLDYLEDDRALKKLQPSYKLNSHYWKQEEDIWLADTIHHYNNIKSHIMLSYFCPVIDGLGSKYQKLQPYQETPSFYSAYYPMHVAPQQLAGWIHGIPNTNVTTMCRHNATFIGCNSYGTPGFYEAMVFYP
jgi:hypothetical protein